MVENQLDVIELQAQQCRGLENEVKTLTNAMKHFQKNTNNLKRERDKNINNSQVKNDKIDANESELAMKTKKIIDLTWELNKIQAKLAHTQQQFESLTAERTALEKNLDTINVDRNNVREKLRVKLIFSHFYWWAYQKRKKKKKTLICRLQFPSKTN